MRSEVQEGAEGTGAAPAQPVARLSVQAFVAIAGVLLATSPSAFSQLSPARAVPTVDDPSADGWATEAFHEAAKAQLQIIAQQIDGPGPIDVAALRSVASDDYTCGVLRPAAPTPVFDDGTIVVARGEVVGESSQPCPGTGSVALAAELVRFLGPLAEAGDRHTKFKIVRVTPGAGGISTQQLVWTTGHTADGSVEMHSTWESLWDPWNGNQPPQLRSFSLSGLETSRLRASGRGTLFSDATVAVLGKDESFRQQLLPGTSYWLLALEAGLDTDAFGHSGVAIGDVNGDGLDDLYLCQPGGLPNRLFVQTPNGTAMDRSAWAGVDWMDRSLSALLIDLDGDGDEDLVTATSRGLLLMANDGEGRFALRASLPAVAYAYSLAAADYDADGDLDLYAARYNPAPFESSDIPSPIPYHDANNGAANVLLRNDGGWRFSDATAVSGMDVDNRRFSFAAAWEDFDRDGDVDLYVANDFGRNCLYRNEAGRFVNVAAAAGVEDIASGMSVAWGDYDRDGNSDLYVSNMFSSAGNRITFQPGFQAALDPAIKAQLQRLARGNSLFANRGDGSFADVSLAAGATMGRWAWGSIFADLNNDGWEDLVVANGYLTAESSADL